MSSAPTTAEIGRDATWLAQALDPAAGLVRLVAMSRERYRSASFLDDRLLQQPVNPQLVPWVKIEEATMPALRSDARWIFHIGHVGSTLVSRLLGEIEGVLAIREPQLLRDLALSPPEVRERYMRPVAKLMSRTFEEDEVACIKATSFASEIAPQLVPRGERTLFMFAQPRNYVASILAGENSVRELRALGDYRAQRLAARGIDMPEPGNDADRAACAWACEVTTLEAAAEAMVDGEIEWADFDLMLGDMGGELGRIATFFGFRHDVVTLDAIARGPLMNRYSKDLNYDYSADLRRQLIAQELRVRGREIDHALAMLSEAAEKSPLLTRAISRAKG